ncbi:hypothetical protein Tco_0140304 [Tanacetum coccineum]
MELLRKHGMEKCDTVTTPMATAKIDADLQGTPTYQTKYRSMIGGLMYLTASRSDIVFATFLCARYQARPTEKQLKEVKRIFDANLAGYLDDYKSTSGGLYMLRISHLDENATACLWISLQQDSNEHVEKGTIELYFVGTEYQLADLFTKALPREMFKYLVHRIVETPDNPFIVPVNIKVIESFMQTVGYQGVVNKKKEVFRYPRFTKLIIADSMKKFPSIPQRLNEYYYSIKDDILLVSAYSTGNVLFQGMLIPDAFLTDEIRATDDYKETTPKAQKTPTLTIVSPRGKKRKQSSRETSLPRKSLKVTIRQKKHNTTPIPPPSDDKETDEIAEATLLSLTLHKTALVVKAQETIANVQEKLAEEEIEKIVEGEEDDELYASEFADSMLSDDVDDSGTRIEPRSHKENLEVINDDDDVNDKDKQDEKKNDDDVEKTNDVAKEKDNDATGSMEIRIEQM